MLRTIALVTALALSGLGVGAGEIQLGLAAKYPGDVGVERDPAVMFHDDFETGEPWSKWTKKRYQQFIHVEEDPKIVRGRRSVRMVCTKGKRSGMNIKWMFPEPRDEVYMRHYARYGPDFGYLHHGGSSFQGFVKGRPHPGGGAGICPNGDKYFWSTFEPDGRWGKYKPPGNFIFYTYWWKMKIGWRNKYWGNHFTPTTQINPRTEKWICLEWRVKVNAPGQPDGELDCWANGVKCGEFREINWRRGADVRINSVALSHYMEEKDYKPEWGNTRTLWYDDVIVATKYIGPLVMERPKAKEAPAAVLIEPKITEHEAKRAIEEKEAGRLFNMARQAERMGQRDVGRKLYQQIVEKFPKTEIAERARAKLE